MNSVFLDVAMGLLAVATVVLLFILFKHGIWHHKKVLILAKDGDLAARIYVGLVVSSILLGLTAALTAR